MTKSYASLLIGFAVSLFVIGTAGCGSSLAPPDTAAEAARAAAAIAASKVPAPTVTGPIGTAGIKGHALWDSWYNLADLGYVEEEYFISGKAKSFPVGSPDADYTTRIIVRRPANAAKFNGTVLLDWVNVTAQFENAVDTLEAHQLFHREGFAYVHVSAQSAGVCCTPLTPKIWDPVRYAALNHPGDAYAYDMFSQIAKAMKAPAGINPMGGLKVGKVIAIGQSQSGTKLRDYVINIQPSAGLIDAFLVHSDGSGEKSYPAEPLVPVIQLFSEREATPDAPNVSSRNYRLWEIAGAAHQDFWIGYHQVNGQGPRAGANQPQQPATADDTLHDKAGNYGEQYDPGQGVCIVEGTQFPLRYSVMAAIHYLDRWVKTGTPPPQGPRYEFDSSGKLARDENFNAKGGIRLPPIDVPVASYRSADCNLGGITVPFTELQLQTLYPTHADYYCKMKAATLQSINQGFLLPEDALDLMSRVEKAKNRWLTAGDRKC
jgi:hypothetical protein